MSLSVERLNRILELLSPGDVNAPFIIIHDDENNFAQEIEVEIASAIRELIAIKGGRVECGNCANMVNHCDRCGHDI